MVESSRKHGAFDPRYSPRPKFAPPNLDIQPDRDASERLDWSAFSALFFPNRRRHDFRALAAYEAYRDTLEQLPLDYRSTTRGVAQDRRSDGSPPTRIARRRRQHARPAAGKASVRVPVAVSPATLTWESEGGATAAHKPR
jgi:hypothetical protein